MKDRATHAVTRRTDYRPAAHRIERIDLAFDLAPEETVVAARMEIVRQGPGPLALDGEALALRRVAIDGRALPPDAFAVDERRLTILETPDRFSLEIETATRPAENTALEGLYVSNGVFCTQCEAEGFRRITYFIDRPDNLATFRTTIRADRGRVPILLSNGNLVASRNLGDGRHEAVWDDPFPKPAYLFALVAGDLAVVEDRFTTRSGRTVALKILVEHGKEGRAGYAMDSLKRAMRWDEETYGLEYDLDVFHIVAVSDFNMGAMENKSLNVFNDKYVLADATTATDADYAAIESIVAHEYFHNWTGNRITCRDWFQLSLKEGLTVYRDQEFTADQRSRAVKRIRDVRTLRARQFPEDAGPLAHSVRPDEYLEINNFYTATVYEKGAEVIRMLDVMLGKDGFRRGMERYVRDNDGKAATCDDFVAAMGGANSRDLGDFMRWYAQAGTPRLSAEGAHDAATQTYTLTLAQRTPATPGQPVKRPMPMPVRLGLLAPGGAPVPLQLVGENAPQGEDRVFEMAGETLTLRFANVAAPPVASINRGFAAPVIVEQVEPDDELALRMAADTDPFNRWEAAQRYATRLLLDAVAGRPRAPDGLVTSLGRALDDVADDPAYAAELLAMPGEDWIAEQVATIDVERIHEAREALRRAIATGLRDRLLALRRLDPGPYRPDAGPAGTRALRNSALAYLALLDEPEMRAMAVEQYRDADNMTDRIAALAILADLERPERAAALADFRERHRDDPLVINKWLAIQAASSHPGTLADVRRLTRDPVFSYANPNKVYALVGAFSANALRFHRADGDGYAFLAEQVATIDPRNPQVAARMLKAFGRWRRFDAGRQERMRAALEGILRLPNLSPDCREIAERSLAG